MIFFREKTDYSAQGLRPFFPPPEKAQAPQMSEKTPVFHSYLYQMPPPTYIPLIPGHIISKRSFRLFLLS